VIQHIVLFTPKAGLSEFERRSFASRTLEALERSPDIARLTVGRRIDVDSGYARLFGDKTYEYSIVLEFTDRSALIRYLNSPDHAEVGRLFWETCENTVITETEIVDRGHGAVDKLV
jgi:hypothetical protein